MSMNIINEYLNAFKLTEDMVNGRISYFHTLLKPQLRQ